MFITFAFQVVAGQKFCIVTEVGISRSCRNDESHKSASLELCPVDSLEVYMYYNCLNRCHSDST